MSPKQKQYITRSMSWFDSVEHREGIHSCPNCNFSSGFDGDAWEKGAIALVIEVVDCKDDSVVVISECPQCFERSWVHYNMETFPFYFEEGKFSKEWLDAVEVELKTRKESAKKAWEASLCRKCVLLKGVEVSTKVWVNCQLCRSYSKLSRSGPAVTECDSYQPD